MKKVILLLMSLVALNAQAVTLINISPFTLDIEASGGEKFSLKTSEKYRYGNLTDCPDASFTITSPKFPGTVLHIKADIVVGSGQGEDIVLDAFYYNSWESLFNVTMTFNIIARSGKKVYSSQKLN